MDTIVGLEYVWKWMEIPNKLFVGGHFFSFFYGMFLLDFKEVGGTCCRPNPLLCRVGNSAATQLYFYTFTSRNEKHQDDLVLLQWFSCLFLLWDITEYVSSCVRTDVAKYHYRVYVHSFLSHDLLVVFALHQLSENWLKIDLWKFLHRIDRSGKCGFFLGSPHPKGKSWGVDPGYSISFSFF